MITDKSLREQMLEDIKRKMANKERNLETCDKCGNDSFRIYIERIIDDCDLECTKCGNINTF